MFDRAQLILAGLSIAILLQLSQPIVAAAPVGKVVQRTQNDSSEAARKAYEEAEKIYLQGTVEAKKSAIAKLEEALNLYRSAGDDSGQAVSLFALGRVYLIEEERQKALEYFNQSLSLYRATSDRTGEAVTLREMGDIYSESGNPQKALEYYNQSLFLFRATSDRREEAIILNRIGVDYSFLGEKQKALEYYNQSLSLFRATSEPEGEAVTLEFIGNVYSDLGEELKALEYYNQSLSLSRARGDRRGQARTLERIGIVYSDLGEKQKALEYFKQSFSLFQATNPVRAPGREVLTLNYIGSVYSDLGDKQKALEYFNQSLSLSRVSNYHGAEVYSLVSIGDVYSDLGEQQKALEYFNQSLSLSRARGDRIREAGILNEIGLAYDNLGEKLKALEYYSQSLPLCRAVGDRSGEARTLFRIAFVKRDRGNLTEALKDIESSIEIIENLRTKIASPELRTSYFATVQNYYEFYIDLLMQLHEQQPNSNYNIKAFEASERSRARSLLELLQESNANIREGISPDLLQQEQKLQQQLDAIEKRRIQLVSLPNPNLTQVEALDKQQQELLQQYQQNQTQIRSTSPRYAALTQPQPLTLPQIQKQVLDDNTILLQYSLGKDRSYLWVVTATGIKSYELPKRADIETAARDFLDATTNPVVRDFPKRVAAASSNLSQLILQPAAAQLGNKRLLIVPEGILHYTPFAALTIPQTAGQNTNNFLIAQHEIITLPSASTLGILRQNYADRKPPNQTLAILADPVFSPDDDRLKGKLTPETTEKLESNNLGLNRSLRTSNMAWPPKRLPFTRRESGAILDLIPASSRSQNLDFAASRTAATDRALANYQILHFATHGIANSEHPELSGILMSMIDETGNPVNGFLRLVDIFNLKLSAKLVVLSACQTGMGQNVKGEGMVGLTRGFMYAGAQRVAVSLWNVDDEGTSVLMQKFYQKMLQEKLAPAAALRAAQLEMMSEEKWKSPYYWAAFMLQGEWK